MTKRPALSARFFDGPSGPLFLLDISPPGTPPKADLLLLSPFAEEMNRSRRMMAAIGRALAHRGIRVLIPDLNGTGDSSGQFEEASWEGWLADVAALRTYIASPNRPLWLGGIRTGALLVADSLSRLPQTVDGVLMIQPVTSGERFLTQFLRLRVAAAMSRGERESVNALKSRLEEGETVTVAGYALAPLLALHMATRRLHDLPPPDDMPVEWIEVGPTERSNTEVLETIPECWRNTALRASHRQDDAFWAMPEPVVSPDLVEFIARQMEGRLS